MRTDWHALEFTKTRGWEARDRDSDDVADFGGLLNWCVRRGLILAAAAKRYRTGAAQRPAAAHRVVGEAHALRHLIYYVLRETGTGGKPTLEQLRELTTWTRRAASVRHLVAGPDGVRWQWQLDPRHFDHLLAPIAWSMSELLVAPEYGRIRLCDGDDCGWLFVDGSRAGTRRWCDMNDCGNLEKMRRFRSRRRSRR